MKKRITEKSKIACLAKGVFAVVVMLIGSGSPGAHPNGRPGDLSANFAKAQTRNQDSLSRFESDLVKLDALYQSRFNTAARDASEKVAEMQTIFTSIYYLAKSKVVGGSDAEEYLEKIVEPILNAVLDLYIYEVNRLSNEMDRDLAIMRLASTTAIAIFEGPLPVGKIATMGATLWAEYELVQI